MRAFKFALICLLYAHPALAQAPAEKLNTTLHSLSKSRETEAELKKKLSESERELAAIRERASAIGERLQQSERRVTNEESGLERVNRELAEKRDEFEARKDDYSKTVLSLLRLRRLPPTALFSNTKQRDELLLAASMLEKTNHAVAQKAVLLRRDIARLKELQSESKQRDATTRAEKTTLRAQQLTLSRELAARQAIQARLNADHAEALEQVTKLSRESESLQELLGKLDANEKAEKKLASAPKPVSKLRVFDGKKGSARAPVAGAVLHRFGEANATNGNYRGMVFKARPGAAVVAPYDGEIVFTGPFRDYGNMVLIKHQNGYISLIAGLGKVSAGLKQAAVRGEPIGTMPESGKTEAYVELRDTSAKPIDPANWFANVEP
jgi:septal ring factor EnvC (AmiA/AmiB activator)